MAYMETPSNWRISDQAVPLSDVARSAACSRRSIDYATRAGAIPVVRRGGADGRGNVRWISVETALRVLAAAMLATAAGVALTEILKALDATGATIINGALTMPLNINA
jgi:hypothetical protein